MTTEQIGIFVVLLFALVLFVTERWRYDIVALLALLAVTLPGIVPADQAFSGFGHAAVITVAAVLVIGRRENFALRLVPSVDCKTVIRDRQIKRIRVASLRYFIRSALISGVRRSNR